jgi:hypothetical protein
MIRSGSFAELMTTNRDVDLVPRADISRYDISERPYRNAALLMSLTDWRMHAVLPGACRAHHRSRRGVGKTEASIVAPTDLVARRVEPSPASGE